MLELKDTMALRDNTMELGSTVGPRNTMEPRDTSPWKYQLDQQDTQVDQKRCTVH